MFASGLESEGFKINPFSLPPTKENLDFLALFLKVLIQGTKAGELDPATERDLFHQVENLYAVDPPSARSACWRTRSGATLRTGSPNGLAADSSDSFSTTPKTRFPFPASSASTSSA